MANLISHEDFEFEDSLGGLIKFKKLLSQFVKSNCGIAIPVQYSDNGQSFTTGEVIYIDPPRCQKDIPAIIGVALHESSHVKYSDFDILKEPLKQSVKQAFTDAGLPLPKNTSNALNYLKSLFNILEDRRIDSLTYTTIPGYRKYYEAFYDKYFYKSEVLESILSTDLFKIAVVEPNQDILNYITCLCYLHTPEIQSNLNIMPLLPKINKIYDLTSIASCSCADILERSTEIFTVLLENFGYDETVRENKSSSSIDDGNVDWDSLTDEQKKELIKAIIEAINNNFNQLDKKAFPVDAGLANETDVAIDVSTIDVSDLVNAEAGDVRKVNCIVITGCSPVVLQKSILGGLYRNASNRYSNDYANSVKSGVSLGRLLGSRLKTRNEELILETRNLPKGKIDKRSLSSIPTGNKNLFHQIDVKGTEDTYVHLSIDASGSMYSCWADVIHMTAALSQAFNMVKGIELSISFRSTTGSDVVVWNAYNSKTVSLKQFHKILECIDCPGGTPEGLCFAATQDVLIKESKGKKSYFINISDGMPGCSAKTVSGNYFSFSGRAAVNFTKKQVDILRACGIEIKSYFLTSHGSECPTDFKTMYGKDSEAISSNELQKLTKSLNKLFQR